MIFVGQKACGRSASRSIFQDFMTSQTARDEYWDQKLEAWPSFRDAEPNAAHAAIVDLERAGKIEMVITQNIDGLHTRAGTSAETLVEIPRDERGHRVHELPRAHRPRCTHEDVRRDPRGSRLWLWRLLEARDGKLRPGSAAGRSTSGDAQRRGGGPRHRASARRYRSIRPRDSRLRPRSAGRLML